jgi:hypothetical protein
MYTLKQYLEQFTYVGANSRESAYDCLAELSIRDNDFNGANGTEYLWDEAQGYDSNMEYCLAQIKRCTTVRSMIEKFIFIWFGNDSFTYQKYKLSVIESDDKLFVSLAYITEY